MHSVLVTGANGFTGSGLANELASRGYQVRALVREGSDLQLLDPQAMADGKIELCRGDVRDFDSIKAASHGVDYVYHIAALYRVAKHPDQVYWDVNVTGTENVLRAAKELDVKRTLHCSTIGVHGGVDDIPASEDSAYAPSDVYQVTKLEGEKLAQKAIQDGQPVTIVRPAGIYGPGDLRFLKLFSMIRSGRFIMFGSGQTLMHMVYIDDLVAGMIQAIESDSGLGQTVILAGEEYVTLNELVRLVGVATNVKGRTWRLPIWPLMTAATLCEIACKPFGFEPPLHRRRAAFFTKDRAFSIERAKRVIGYQPQVSLEMGLKKTADWYFAKKLLA